jgi:general secretion pathway protein K
MTPAPAKKSGGRKPQRGFAVVMAMLVVALAATVAGYMAWQQSLWVRQAENLNNLAQADAIARAAGRWMMMMLAEDAKNGDGKFQSLLMSGNLPAVPVEHGAAAIKMADMQGLFNINNIAPGGKLNQPELDSFRRLLTSQGLEPDLANAVLDWIDADSEPTLPGGAEDPDYLALNPPYRAANQALFDIDELVRVKGFDAAALAKLRPFISALPAPSTINVNTAGPEVLSALFANLSLIDAQDIVSSRKDKAFVDLDDAHKRYPNLDFPSQRFSADSQYFLASATAHFDRSTVAYQMMLARSSKGGVQLMWQKPVAY